MMKKPHLCTLLGWAGLGGRERERERVIERNGGRERESEHREREVITVVKSTGNVASP